MAQKKVNNNVEPQKRPWYKSIFFRTTLLSWLIISFTLTFFVISITPYQKKVALDRMKSQANSIAASVSQVTANSIVLEDYSFAVDHCMKVVEESEAVNYVVITKHDGFSLVHTTESWQMDTLRGFWQTDYEGICENLLANSESPTQNVFHYSYPFQYSGIDWGRIHIGLSLKEYNAYMKSMLYRTTFLSLLCAGLGLLASLMFARNITKPMLKLDEATQRIAAGERSVRAQINSDDELGSLAQSFNSMTDALQDAHDKLEERVKERTASLAKVNKAMKVEIAHRISAEEAIKESLQEKEVLLKEIHHRVKNNLQIIQSLLYLQSKGVKDENILNHFRDSQNRVKSMALIHEKLYRSDDFANINFNDYVRSLTGHLLQTYQTTTSNVDIRLDIEDVSFTIDQGIPCGLIINELVSNSFKYAFPNGKKGLIEIKLSSSNGHKKGSHKHIHLNVMDNGVGMPQDFDYMQSSSLGLKLVNNLSSQLDGEVEFKIENGTKVMVSFEMEEN